MGWIAFNVRSCRPCLWFTKRRKVSTRENRPSCTGSESSSGCSQPALMREGRTRVEHSPGQLSSNFYPPFGISNLGNISSSEKLCQEWNDRMLTKPSYYCPYHDDVSYGASHSTQRSRECPFRESSRTRRPCEMLSQRTRPMFD